ncbi:MAG TPA: hypothetical protein VI111_01810 [Thermoleophilaceae bacterium]
MTKRTSIGVGVAAIAIGAGIVVPALAQVEDLPETDISTDIEVSSTKAGTPKHPKGVSITVKATLTTEPDVDPPIVTGVENLFGPGAFWNGADYVKCSKRVLDTKGPKGCPRESIMGAGIATAKADTVDTKLTLTLINGGARRLLAYATLTNPARVQETIVVKATNATGKWRHRESFRIPKSLQVVAGIPIEVTSLRFTLGGKPYAKNFITTTSCPKGGWRYHNTVHYLYDLTGQTATDTFGGSVSCTS